MAVEIVCAASSQNDAARTSQKGSSNGPSSSKPQQQPLEKVFGMTKGEGQESYSRNSSAQAFIVNKFALPELNEALERVILPDDGRVVVADLGCASGANTISNLTFIVEKLRSRFLRSSTLPSPEFQAFFNDLPSNDFNNLFQLLSTDPRTSSNKLFVAGVPGSFYGRLFSRSSVHVFFSSHCLHWMSQIPEAVLDKESPAYNKGRVWINDSSQAVRRAYKDQSFSDLKNFLNARAAELVQGGLLFLFFSGRSSSDISNCLDDSLSTSMWRYQDEAWSNLISEGVLTEEQRDTFNIPTYRRSIEEVREAVESCASDFEVHILELQDGQTSLGDNWLNTEEPGELSRKLTRVFKSVLNSLMEAHVGKESSELFWQHYEKVICSKLSRNQEGKAPSNSGWRHTVALIRK